MKICFLASSGGHLEEISCLRSIASGYDSFLVTEKTIANNSDWGSNVYYMRQLNRKEPLFVMHYLALYVKAARIMIREKPDYIISTGALMTYPFCVWGRHLRKKIIYIESFARIDRPSLTGRLMYPIADLFIVQWEEMLKFFPKAVYGGGIF